MIYHDKDTQKELNHKYNENRKQTKALKAIMDELGGLSVSFTGRSQLKRKLEKAGYTGELDEKTVIAWNALQRAKENSRDFEVYRDTIGEKISDKVDLNVDAKVDAIDILNRHFKN